jgi:hypothetical protein
MHHTGDGEVFERDHVVAFDQGVGQLVEGIFALIGEALVLALQQHNRLLTVLAALLAARNPPLGHPQPLLGLPIPAWVFSLLTLTRGVQVLQAHVDTDRTPRLGQWLRLGHLARETRVPLARLLADANGLNRALQRSVPAHGHTLNARQLQAPPIDLEARSHIP